MNWKKNLNDLLQNVARTEEMARSAEAETERKIQQFFALASQALDEIKDEIVNYGRRVEINSGKYAHAVDIYNGNKIEFSYAVKIRTYMPTAKAENRYFTANNYDPVTGVQGYDINKIHTINKTRIMRDFMCAYKNKLQDAPKYLLISR